MQDVHARRMCARAPDCAAACPMLIVLDRKTGIGKCDMRDDSIYRKKTLSWAGAGCGSMN